MATRNWTLVAGGNFGSDFGWSPTIHPVAGDTANITSALDGKDYNVAVTDNQAAARVNIGAANAELDVIGGVLTTGAIDVTAGTLGVLAGGEITGGTTITFDPSAEFRAIDGTLDGVTWMGNLILAGITQSSLLTVTTSLTVLDKSGSGPGEIDITGPGASMNVESSMTLDGTGGVLQINLGTSAAQSEFLSVGSGDILTIGSQAIVSQTAAGSTVDISDISTSGTLVNLGTLSFTAGAGSSAVINPDAVINSGTIVESGGIQNGESLDISAQTSFTNTASGLISIGDFGRVGISGANNQVRIDGQIQVAGGSTLDLNTSALGAGTIAISTLSTADMSNFTGTVLFSDPTGDLALEQPGSFTGTVAGMSVINSLTHDVIDLLLTQVSSIAPYAGDAFGGTLTVMEGASPVATINLVGDYRNAVFGFSADTAGNGTNIFLVACFASGTRIATPAGEVAVEDLRVATKVTLADGGAAPIVWLGHRTIDCARHPDPARVWPVRVRAGAFGEGVPRRDLFLSPDHAVFVDDVLIPVGRLVNGDSIVQVPVDTVTYHHVELPTHDLLLAEGLAVESYLDTGDRSDFANTDGVIRLFPDFAGRAASIPELWETAGLAPLVLLGAKPDAARRRLALLSARG